MALAVLEPSTCVPAPTSPMGPVFASGMGLGRTGSGDIHHQGRGPGKAVHNGDDRRQEVTPASVVPPEFGAEVVALVRQPGRSIDKPHPLPIVDGVQEAEVAKRRRPSARLATQVIAIASTSQTTSRPPGNRRCPGPVARPVIEDATGPLTSALGAVAKARLDFERFGKRGHHPCVETLGPSSTPALRRRRVSHENGPAWVAATPPIAGRWTRGWRVGMDCRRRGADREVALTAEQNASCGTGRHRERCPVTLDTSRPSTSALGATVDSRALPPRPKWFRAAAQTRSNSSWLKGRATIGMTTIPGSRFRRVRRTGPCTPPAGVKRQHRHIPPAGGHEAAIGTSTFRATGTQFAVVSAWCFPTCASQISLRLVAAMGISRCRPARLDGAHRRPQRTRSRRRSERLRAAVMGKATVAAVRARDNGLTKCRAGAYSTTDVSS